MDLHVERQCLNKAKEGSKKDFFLLFDSNFDSLHKYVFRRVSNDEEARNLVKLTFFDAIGQLNQADESLSFIIWLYSLAKLRINTYFERQNITEVAPIRLDEVISVSSSNQNSIKNVNLMMDQLTLDEREIVRLKLLENVSDGDVMAVLGSYDDSIGTKIYKVLKKVNSILFENDSEASGVYFGKITSLFENIRSIESFFNTDGFKLLLKEDLRDRFDRKDVSMNASVKTITPNTNTKNNNMTTQKPTGSNDPAKIFVEAVREMREEEALNKIRNERRIEKQEAFYDFIDRFKLFFILVPVFLFIIIGSFVVFKLMYTDKGVTRGVISKCNATVKVLYDGNFSITEKQMLASAVSNNACETFEGLESISYKKINDELVKSELAINNVIREYELVKMQDQFIITRYAKTNNSNV